MSIQNLKKYRINFLTYIGQMNFKVTFPCSVKAVWKRSKQSAQTTSVSVTNGKASFDQTISMYINMYYDSDNAKFIEKKCLYSFLILTQKGEKSAGTVTIDLADLLNKRIYELHNQFPLQKCPLPNTKIEMKIYYQESIEQGYDSMSQISAQNLDISTMSTDLSEMVQSLSVSENKRLDQDSETKSKSESASNKVQDNETNFDLLNQSDINDSKGIDHESHPQGEKMSENIQALSDLTGKIDSFVSQFSGNLKSQIESLRQKNKQLTESLNQQIIKRQQMQSQNLSLKNSLAHIQKTYRSETTEYKVKLENSKSTIEELQSKVNQKQELCSRLERNLEENGESQSSYLTNLKETFSVNQKKLKNTISQMNDQILGFKKEKIQMEEDAKSNQGKLQSLSLKLSQSQEQCQQLSRKQANRERELSELRARFEGVYERMVTELKRAFK